MTTHMDNWEKNAIMVEVECLDVSKLDLKQTKIDCPWCKKRHLVITDKSATASGHMLCSNCGQFFRWSVFKAEGYTEAVGESKRSRVVGMKREVPPPLKTPPKPKGQRGKA